MRGVRVGKVCFMRINSNITAYITNNVLLRNEKNFGLSTAKLSSGYKINNAGDDPTGYAITNRMRVQLAALESADVNATTGKSVLETADSALSEVTSMIQRMNELATKAANGTLSSSDRESIQAEVEQLNREITRITKQTELNERKLFDGSMDNTGYCTNDYRVQVDSYSDVTSSGSYTLSKIEEDISGGKLTLTVEGFPESTDSVTMSFNYPKYHDDEKMTFDPGLNQNIGTAITSGLYVDGEGRGSVKICADGSQYITINGANGESLTLHLGKEATNPTQTTETFNGETYAITNYAINISDAEISLTGKGALRLQVGANEEAKIDCKIPELNLAKMDLDDIDLTTAKSATGALEKVQHALTYINNVRSTIGAYQNRVEQTLEYLAANSENLTSAMSRIRDTDMADEMTNYANQQILVQAATSMLAQANQAPQQALQLLQ